MTNTKKAKWIGCLAAVAVFAVAGTATANAKDHHRHHDGGNTAVQIVRAIVDLLDGPDIVVASNPAPVIAPPPAYVQPAPVIVHKPAPRRDVFRPAPPQKHVKPAPQHHDNRGKAPAPKRDNKKGKGGRR